MTRKTTLNIKRYRSIFGAMLSLIIVFYLSGCATAGGYDNQSSSGGYYNDNSYVNENQVLDTYGEWIAVAPYGTVWRPFVSQDWQPYYYGNWIRTENGWTWVSYEPFGWIVYHYGYWDYRPETGWFWIESRDWTPARVEWAYQGDYVGWAPMPPPQGGYFDQPATQINVWNVVDIRNFTQDNVGRYRLRRLPEGFRQHAGEAPDINTVERYTNRQIRIVRSNRERVTVNGRQYDRLVLPDREAATVRQYEPQVTRDVIRTRGSIRTNNGNVNRNGAGNTVVVPSEPTRTSAPNTNAPNTNTSGARNNGTRNNDGTRNSRDNNTDRSRGGDNNARTDNPGNRVVVPSNPGNKVVVPENPRVNKPAEPRRNDNPNTPNTPRRETPRGRAVNPGRDQQQRPEQQQRPAEQNKKSEDRGNKVERQNRDAQGEKSDDKDKRDGRDSR